MGRCPRPRVEPAALVGLALLLLVMEIQWVGAFLISTAVHEGSHLLALGLQGVSVRAITIGFTGARIETPPLTRKQELLSALAGPLGGFLLCFLAMRFPKLAVCAFFHSACNLFPLYPLDGGRVLRCMLPQGLSKNFERIALCIILLGTIRLSGYLGLLILAVIFGRPLLEKYLAKLPRNSYNRPTNL